jgi:ankyrin repeat protein
MAKRRSKPRFDNLTHAVLDGSVEDVRGMIAGGTDPDDREEADEPTPLMEAAAHGRLDMVEVLVAAGADVNALVDDQSGELDPFPFLEELFASGRLSGMTPLAYAVLYGQKHVCDYLIHQTVITLRSEAEALGQAKAAQPSGRPRPQGTPKKPKSASQAAREELLSASAAARRWVWSCLLCGRQGYKPALPEEIDRKGTAGRLRKLFGPLPLGKDRICERCTEKAAAAMRRRDERRQRRTNS